MNTPSPSLRTRAEYESALRGLPLPDTDDARPLEVCLVAGEKDHGPGEHEYQRWQNRWQSILNQADHVTCESAFEWPEKEQWNSCGLVVLYFWNHNWNHQRYAELDAFLDRGGGVVAIHSALVEDHDPHKLAKRFGLAGQRPQLQFRHGPLCLEANRAESHPIMRGIENLHLEDETYWDLAGDSSGIELLASSREGERVCPMLWTNQPGKGRVVCAVPGHYAWTFDDPIYRLILLRSMAWAAGSDAARFQELASTGIEFRDA